MIDKKEKKVQQRQISKGGNGERKKLERKKRGSEEEGER